jgi:integrase/recombinase XerD
LVQERELSIRSVCTAVAALRFLDKGTLHKEWTLEEFLPVPKKPQRLPVVLSPEEVLPFLAGGATFKPRVILPACYAAGLRISEAAHLKPSASDRQRLVIRVEQGKGQKDRYGMLSPPRLETFRSYWRQLRPKERWFPGDVVGKPITNDAVALACQKARRRSGLQKPITPPSLRHAFAVHRLAAGAAVRTLQLLLGHRRLATTAQYLRIATTKVCAPTSPLDLRPRPRPVPPAPAAPCYF